MRMRAVKPSNSDWQTRSTINIHYNNPPPLATNPDTVAGEELCRGGGNDTCYWMCIDPTLGTCSKRYSVLPDGNLLIYSYWGGCHCPFCPFHDKKSNGHGQNGHNGQN